jgi:hypothetical protein
MSKRLPLPDNRDGSWRIYYGSGQYHHYQPHAVWSGQTADCRKKTNAGSGAYSPLRDTQDFYQPVCGKCRKIVSAANKPEQLSHADA